MSNIRAILIDPFACTVTEIEHDASDYKNVYPLLSHETMPVRMFQIVRIGDDGDAIFVDEEGLLKPCDRWFILRGFSQPLAGKGVVLGSDDEGETTSAKTSLITVRGLIRFAERQSRGLALTEQPWRKATA